MSRRMTAVIAACFLAVGAMAGDKKKLDYAPETGPQPRTVDPAPMTLPDPYEVKPYQNEYDPHERTAAGERLIIRTYGVGDLVMPIPPAGSTFKPGPTLETELIKKLTAAVAPKCWTSAGGSATVEYFPLGLALVIKTTPAVHDAVAKYLDDLRQMQDTQCSVEVKIVTVTEAGLEKLGFARDFLPKAGELRTKIKFLTNDDLARLDLRGADPVTMVMPRLTVLNGQEGSITVGGIEYFLTGVTVQTVKGQLVFTPKNEPHDLGVKAKIRPEMSADGKFIKLAVNIQAHDLVVKPVGLIPLTVPVQAVDAGGRKQPPAPFTQFLQDPRIVTRSVDETVTLPDGGTVVFYGGPATVEETTKEVVPTFGDVPFLRDMFGHEKKVKETNHLLVFATPRAIRPNCDECVECAGGTGKLPKLMVEYGRACREGNVEEARRLALECVVIDPTCFSKK